MPLRQAQNLSPLLPKWIAHKVNHIIQLVRDPLWEKGLGDEGSQLGMTFYRSSRVKSARVTERLSEGSSLRVGSPKSQNELGMVFDARHRDAQHGLCANGECKKNSGT